MEYAYKKKQYFKELISDLVHYESTQPVCERTYKVMGLTPIIYQQQIMIIMVHF